MLDHEPEEQEVTSDIPTFRPPTEVEQPEEVSAITEEPKQVATSASAVVEGEVKTPAHFVTREEILQDPMVQAANETAAEVAEEEELENEEAPPLDAVSAIRHRQQRTKSTRTYI